MARTPSSAAGAARPGQRRAQASCAALKLGKLLDTLPERLTLARQQQLPHADFLELVLADEVTRRDTNSAALRARAAGLDPAMRLDTWDPAAAVRFDHPLWNELFSLRFLDAAHGALVLGPVGVGKTHLATALGHIAVRRGISVHMARADKLFKRLKAARLDNTLDAECAASPTSSSSSSTTSACSPRRHRDRRLLRDRRRTTPQASHRVTSNSDASEWLAHMADPLLAQSAVDRLTSTAHELVIEGESYRRRQRPGRHAQ